MARKPSLRSKSHSRPVDLNLVPYLDIVINIIMFMLFTSTGLIQIGVINVNAPRYHDPLTEGENQEQPNPDEKQLNLTVGVTYEGIFIAAVGGVWSIKEGDQESAADKIKKPSIPLLLSEAPCQEALNRKAPPPASCYDYKKLTQEMVKIKNAFPQETKIIIYAQPDVPYEVLVRVMDATRNDGDRALFFDVILSPEIV
jgi:biopolymer transport protein TolR